MKKKKILFLINDLGGGGAEKVLVNLVNHMDKDKYNITLRTVMNRGVNRQFLSKEVHYDYVFKRPFRGINLLYKLPKNYIYNKVTKGDFDLIVVYLHGVLTKIVSHAPKNQKTINFLHFDMEKASFLNNFPSQEEMLRCLKSYNAIVSVSQSVQDSFIRKTGLTKNLHVIYNTYDVKNIKKRSKEKVDNAEFNKSDINICAIGSLNKRKAFDRIIRSLAKIKEEHKTLNFQLFILGEGPEHLNLEKLIKDTGMEGSIFLLGYTTNPYKYLKNCDLFVSSSFGEGFATVAVESTVLGVPILTTHTSGMTEILGEDNEFGMVVKNDEESFYKGLKKLLLEPTILEHYKQQATERSSFFSTQKAVKEVEQLVEQVLAPE